MQKSAQCKGNKETAHPGSEWIYRMLCTTPRRRRCFAHCRRGFNLLDFALTKYTLVQDIKQADERAAAFRRHTHSLLASVNSLQLADGRDAGVLRGPTRIRAPSHLNHSASSAPRVHWTRTGRVYPIATDRLYNVRLAYQPTGLRTWDRKFT